MSAPGARAMPRWAWVGLAAILVLDVWLRAHTFAPTLRARWHVSVWPVVGAEAEPLDCDEAAYAYIGHRLRLGDAMYRDVSENKPPLGYWLYALAVAAGGYDELTIRMLPIPFVLATIALVGAIGRRVGGPGAALVAAAAYAVASTDPYLFGNGANLEHFLNMFATASLYLVVRAWSGGRGALVGAGVCVGAASLVKQVAGAHLPVFAAALLVRRPDGGRSVRARLLDLAALAGGFALAWGLAVGVLVLQGAGPDAFEDIVRYGGALATDVPPEPHAPPGWMRWLTGNADPRGALPWPFGRTRYLVWWGTGTWPLWLAAAPALAWLGLGPPTGPRRLVAAWTLSAIAQVMLPGLYWPHYYLLPLPGVALGVGLATAAAGGAARRALGRGGYGRAMIAGTASLACASAVAGTAALLVRDYLRVDPALVTERCKGGKQWVADRDLGRQLGASARGRDDPTLFVWGWQSPLLVYGRLNCPTRHFFTDNLLRDFAERDHPVVRPRVARIMRDLRARPPAFLFAGYRPFPALRDFLRERYRPSARVYGLWTRRDDPPAP